MNIWNECRTKAVNYFRKKAPLEMFERSLDSLCWNQCVTVKINDQKTAENMQIFQIFIMEDGCLLGRATK